ncbi:MAG: toprim domain-containing protein [Chitinophagaceae bacterium]
MRKSLENSVTHYEEKLNSEEGHLAINYLKLRGITKEAAAYFRLGLVKDPLPESGHDFQEGRLAIPYITNTGIVQIRFRSIPYDGIPGNPEPSPKMKSEAGAGTTMFNVRALNSTDNLIAICEGEFDTMTAHIAGIPTIGIPGANAWQSLFALGLKFRKAIILADNDDHGEGLKFAEKVQADLRGARIILMPEGHDVNSFVVENGIDALRQKVGL